MDKKIIKFHDIEIKKQTFHQHKSPTSISNVINKIVLSKKVCFGEKRF